MIHALRLSRARTRRGATTVEFAITVPILFAVVFTAFEFSRMNVIRHTAVNAAYEGRVAVLFPALAQRMCRKLRRA